MTLRLSTLGKTYILDIDGTILKHNGYKIDGFDTLLDGVREFFKTLKEDDRVILLTARKSEDIPSLEQFLREHGIIYHALLCDMPFGERILVNDIKPSGLKTAYAYNKGRDSAFNLVIMEEENL